MHNPNRPYHRAEIDLVFNKVKAQLHEEAVQRGGGVALFEDCYTRKTLRGGEAYDYEHIRSSEELFMKYRHLLTNEQIAAVVNCAENVKTTLRTINQSKGKRRFEEWATPDVIAKHGLCMKTAVKSVENADRGIRIAFERLNAS